MQAVQVVIQLNGQEVNLEALKGLGFFAVDGIPNRLYKQIEDFHVSAYMRFSFLHLSYSKVIPGSIVRIDEMPAFPFEQSWKKIHVCEYVEALQSDVIGLTCSMTEDISVVLKEAGWIDQLNLRVFSPQGNDEIMYTVRDRQDIDFTDDAPGDLQNYLERLKQFGFPVKSETCEFCGNTGFIGSPYETGHYPCTDCEIWERKVAESRKKRIGEV